LAFGVQFQQSGYLVSVKNLRLIKMNTPEQSLRCDRENAIVDETRITRVSQSTIVQSLTPVAPTRHWHFVAFIFLMSLGEISVLVYLLRDVPTDLLRQEFEGLGRVICGLACVGLFVWRVSRALAQDTRQAEESTRSETSLITRAPSQRGPQQDPSGTATWGHKPVELRT